MGRAAYKRQTRLGFSPIPSSSPATARYNQQIRERAAAIILVDGNRQVSEKAKNRIETVSHLLTPSPSRKPAKDISPSSESSDDSEPRASGRRSDTGRRADPGTQRALFSSPGIGTKNTLLTSSPSRKRRRHTHSHAVLQEDDKSDSDAFPTSQKRQRTAADNLVDLSDDGGSESDMPLAPVRRRSRCERRTETLKPTPISSDDDNQLPSRSRLWRQKGVRGIVHEDTPDHDESITTVAYRPGHIVSREEQEELKSELQDLASSSSSDVELVDRPQRSTPSKSKHQLAIEKLKRRRDANATAKNRSDAITVGSESDAAESALLAESSDEDVLENPQIPTSSAREMFQADEEDEDFLTDDGDDTMGAPTESIPLEFTRFASAKPKELFRYAIEWMVQKKLNPGFNSSDGIYTLAFDKLDDEIKGLAGSKFESSVWKPEFLFALRARPDLVTSRLGTGEGEHKGQCGACNRSGHIPTYEVQFHGTPYHKNSLEEVETTDDDDEDEEVDDASRGDRITRDAHGRVIVPESHSFFIGRFCMANAGTAHTLQHWRFHLFEWVVEYLSSAGHSDADKIVQRDKWGEPKRRRFANKVLDEMAQTGKVKELYLEFRAEVERARDAKHRSQGRDFSP